MRLSLFEMNWLLSCNAHPVEKLVIIKSARDSQLLRNACHPMMAEYDAALAAIRRSIDNDRGAAWIRSSRGGYLMGRASN